MSWNNVLPWWLIELDAVLSKCETCLPGERLEIYEKAAEKLRENKMAIPEHIRDFWLEKIEYGIPWSIPRRM